MGLGILLKDRLRKPWMVLRKIREMFYKKHAWEEGASGLSRKKYGSYEEYIEHQRSKLRQVQGSLLRNHDGKYSAVLVERLQKHNVIAPGMNALCLAARLGTEVKSFLHLGCFAVGIDLNPGADNKYVLTGDFHDVQFPDHTVDVVFSNSLDHALDLNKLLREIKRVLKPRGYLIVEIVAGVDEGFAPGYWEACAWKKVDDVIDLLKREGFTVLNKLEFDYPWPGQHVCLRFEGPSGNEAPS